MAIIEAPTQMETNPLLPTLKGELNDLRAFDAGAGPEPTNIVSNAGGAGAYQLSVKLRLTGPAGAWAFVNPVTATARFFLEGLGGGAPEIDIPPVVSLPFAAPPAPIGEVTLTLPPAPTAPLLPGGTSRIYRVSAAVQLTSAGGTILTGYIDGALLNVVP